MRGQLHITNWENTTDSGQVHFMIDIVSTQTHKMDSVKISSSFELHTYTNVPRIPQSLMCIHNVHV